MTSQLNVDTIVDKAGSGGTNVKIGNTSTYVSENSTTTQNAVQGMAKSWANASGNGTTLNDSFNVASITDTGTGNIFFTATNNTANTNYSLTGGGQVTTLTGTGVFFHNVQGGATTGYQVQHFQNGASADPQGYTGITLHGDLA